MKIDATSYRARPVKSKKPVKLGSLLSSNPFQKISDKQKEDFYREFSTLVKSGVDFNQALTILSEQQKSKLLKSVYQAINTSVVKGKPLHEAIQEHSYFTPYEYYSIKIGEDTKRLPDIFDQLQKYFARKIRMRRQVVSVLAYPVFVLLITFAVLYFMLNYVVPMFASVFQQFGKELPDITKFVVKVSDNFNAIALGTLAVILLIVLTFRFFRDNAVFKDMTSRIILRIPFFGNLIRKVHLARFCQSMGLLLSAKTPLVTALKLTEKMITFHPLKTAIGQSQEDILKGESLSQSFSRHSFFTSKILSLTKIGEQINELDRMYDNLAEQYNDDVDHASKMIGTILEPVMIVIIGGIVGFIMVAMYSPIFNLSKVLEN